MYASCSHLGNWTFLKNDIRDSVQDHLPLVSTLINHQNTLKKVTYNYESKKYDVKIYSFQATGFQWIFFIHSTHQIIMKVDAS